MFLIGNGENGRSFNEKGRTRRLTHGPFSVDHNGHVLPNTMAIYLTFFLDNFHPKSPNSHLGLTNFVPVRVGEVRGRGAAGGLAPEVARHHLAPKIFEVNKKYFLTIISPRSRASRACSRTARGCAPGADWGSAQ